MSREGREVLNLKILGVVGTEYEYVLRKEGSMKSENKENKVVNQEGQRDLQIEKVEHFRSKIDVTSITIVGGNRACIA